jgi:cytochrome c biogenesis protein CcmG/thiol:disulfide interchange protein DsbE
VSARIKLGAQALAVAAVAGLLGLLVWKIAHGSGKTSEPKNFTLQRLDRPGTLELSSLRGKVVVLNFWASWCIPCKEEARVVEQIWRRFRHRGVVVLGVDTADATEDARGFMRRFGLTYPIVRSKGKDLWGPYGLSGVPETRLIDRQGKYVGKQFYGPVTARALEDRIHLALPAA